ncbi:hypothetical protein EJ06DRAFT_521667 [Trichodelitschia bisporula]|uniref:Uncharacterized protein n=1 Tax=Trichodelitschia bisporula TaxID=703511 RepID=A0A6G1HY99_9PEZI|nr:hypothetical protein EJ06DRAFT_521667 [Trichodelitschia bisporula]
MQVRGTGALEHGGWMNSGTENAQTLRTPQPSLLPRRIASVEKKAHWHHSWKRARRAWGLRPLRRALAREDDTPGPERPQTNGAAEPGASPWVSEQPHGQTALRQVLDHSPSLLSEHSDQHDGPPNCWFAGMREARRCDDAPTTLTHLTALHVNAPSPCSRAQRAPTISPGQPPSFPYSRAVDKIFSTSNHLDNQHHPASAQRIPNQQPSSCPRLIHLKASSPKPKPGHIAIRKPRPRFRIPSTFYRAFYQIYPCAAN